MPTDRLDTTFAALATRRGARFWSDLPQGETSVKELAQPFDITAPAITKHLKVLEPRG